MDTEANESSNLSSFESNYNPRHDLVELMRSHKLCIWLSAHRACHFKTNLTNHCTTSTTNCIITARTLSLLSHTVFICTALSHITAKQFHLRLSSQVSFPADRLQLLHLWLQHFHPSDATPNSQRLQNSHWANSIFYDKKTQSGPCILKCGKFFI